MATTSYFPCPYREQQRVASGFFGLTPEIDSASQVPGTIKVVGRAGAMGTCSRCLTWGPAPQPAACLPPWKAISFKNAKQSEKSSYGTDRPGSVHEQTFIFCLTLCFCNLRLCFCNLCLIPLSSKLFPCCILRV